MNRCKVRIIAGEKSWIEGNAVNQLNHTAEKIGMILAVGLPDLHPGRGIPVGAAFISKEIFYPFVAGNDIGCGISLWQTTQLNRKLKIDKLVKKLKQSADTTVAIPPDADIKRVCFNGALGTIGGGNHFAEFTKVEKVFNTDLFAKLNLDKSKLFLLVHSGSRGLGQTILREHVDQFRDDGLIEGSPEADSYLEQHNDALQWAVLNRRLIAERLFSASGLSGKQVSDTIHNSITPLPDGCWLHRKGAAPADAGPVVIAGSRGSLSYLVQPIGDQAGNAFSLAHGAGRKWARNEAKPRLARKFTADQLRQGPKGNRVICTQKDLLFEEAPQAYKDIDRVIDDMVNAGLIEVIAAFYPVITYKN